MHDAIAAACKNAIVIAGLGGYLGSMAGMPGGLRIERFKGRFGVASDIAKEGSRTSAIAVSSRRVHDGKYFSHISHVGPLL